MVPPHPHTALRFQPIRRPQINQKKPARPAFPKSIPAPPSQAPATSTAANPAESKDTSTTSSPGTSGPTQPPPPPAQPHRTTLADWAATEEDEYIYGAAGEKRQRGGRRAKKKKTRHSDYDDRRGTDWDEVYDPSRPTNVDEYLRSDERVREVQEWKSVLYAHRRRRKGSYDESDEDSEGEDERPAMGSMFSLSVLFSPSLSASPFLAYTLN